MSNTFYIKRGDRSPSLLYELPAGVNLAGASVVFNLRPKKFGGPTRIKRGAAVVDSVNDRTVRYDFAAADTVNAGEAEGEFEVTYADGNPETFPNKGYIDVFIDEDLY